MKIHLDLAINFFSFLFVFFFLVFCFFLRNVSTFSDFIITPKTQPLNARRRRRRCVYKNNNNLKKEKKKKAKENHVEISASDVSASLFLCVRPSLALSFGDWLSLAKQF